MAKITDFDKAKFEIVLPPPLDKPMKHFVYSTGTKEYHIIEAINELIKRQNALIELMKKLVMK